MPERFARSVCFRDFLSLSVCGSTSLCETVVGVLLNTGSVLKPDCTPWIDDVYLYCLAPDAQRINLSMWLLDIKLLHSTC